MKFLKTYKSTLILMLSMVIGSIVGMIMKEDASVLEPFGTLFLNMLLVVIVPLIFVTIITSIARMEHPKRIGKIARAVVVTFIITSLVAVFSAIAVTYTLPLVSEDYSNELVLDMDESVEGDSEINILDKTVELISVNDFSKLLSRDNIIAIVLMSLLIGVAINMSPEHKPTFLKVLIPLNDMMMNIIKLIMYYAPIGIGCYFASTVGQIGSAIAIGYINTFVIYTAVSLVFFFGVYTLYAFIAGGKDGVKNFWKHAVAPTLTSLATCSSAACIPVNIETAKKIGVSADVAETVIPLGTSFHKDGSIIGSVFKIMFLVCLFGADISLIQIVGVALVANLLVTAVPIGGGSISEMLIITLLGFPVAALPLLTMVATVIDAPATMLNVVGDTSSAMLVNRMVDGKNWNKK